MLTPRPYQLVGRDFLAAHRIALLADEMRVGKTGQAVLAAHKQGARSVTVLCPVIAVPIWHYAFREWYTSMGAAMGPKLQVMSFERGLIHQDELLAGRQDVTIVDECHFAGNPDAKRTKLIYGKEGLVWKSGALWALSGTPAPKHAGSLWPILRAAGVVGMPYDDFCRRYCRFSWDGKIIGTREEHIPELRALWQLIGLRRTRKEVAPDMPDIGYDFLQVELEKRVDLPSLGPMSDEALLAAMESRADVDREDRIAVAMAKIPPLLEEVSFDLANGLLKQTVIFGWHLEPLKKIVSSLRAMGFRAEMLYGDTPPGQKVEIQERFRLGLLDAVVGQIRACGTAIDLSAASHGYFLELDWVPGNNGQAANRLIAIGKNEPVTMDVVTMPGSVDDKLQGVLLRRVRELSKLF